MKITMMMMSFNTDLLDEDGGSIIDLSGKGVIPESESLSDDTLMNGVNSNVFNNALVINLGERGRIIFMHSLELAF